MSIPSFLTDAQLIDAGAVSVDELTQELAKRLGRALIKVDRVQAIEIARKHAKLKPKDYYSEPFEPHEWVIDALVEALRHG